ncbi:unnamed protein product, partial [marine sediment metagenome]
KNNDLAPYSETTINADREQLYFNNTGSTLLLQTGLYQTFTQDWKNNVISIRFNINFNEKLTSSQDMYPYIRIDGVNPVTNDYLTIRLYCPDLGRAYGDYKLLIYSNNATYFDSGWGYQNSDLFDLLHPDNDKYTIQMVLDIDLAGSCFAYAGPPDDLRLISGSFVPEIKNFVSNTDIKQENISYKVGVVSWENSLGYTDTNAINTVTDITVTEHIPE